MLKRFSNRSLKNGAYLYFVSLFGIVFFYGERLSNKDYRGYYNLYPLKKIFYYNWENPNRKLMYYSEILGNVILFLPFAAAISLIFKDISKQNVLIILVLCTIFIESLQFGLSIGVFDVDDIILNICGGGIGQVLYERWIKSYL